jgi:4-hydroxy-4-methyl-2-oxoglutarate aldolase
MYIIQERVSILSQSFIEQFRSVTPSALGHWIDQGCIDNRIRLLQPGVLLLGTAVTVQTVGRDSLVCHKVIDLILPGDVIVIDRSGDRRYACWGEMTALAAHIAGAAGVVIDGPVTDVQVLRQSPLPISCAGTTVLTTQFLGLGGAINVPIVCGGVVVKPGDLIFGDENGILVIDPGDAERLLSLAVEEEKGDQDWRVGLLQGKRPSQMAPIDDLMSKRNHP